MHVRRSRQARRRGAGCGLRRAGRGAPLVTAMPMGTVAMELAIRFQGIGYAPSVCVASGGRRRMRRERNMCRMRRGCSERGQQHNENN